MKTVQKQLNSKIKKNTQKKIKLTEIEFIKNNKLTSKTQQRFKHERRIVFTEENGDKIMQSNDSIETFAFGTSEGLKVTAPQNNAKYG